MKPFLILQSRPEDETSDNEFEAFLKYGGLRLDQVRRIRIEQNGIPELNLDDYSGVILGGGPYNMTDSEEGKDDSQKKAEKDLFALLDKIVEQDCPFFGACLGVGFLTVHQGGQVSKECGEDVGGIDVCLSKEGEVDQLLVGLPKVFRAFVGHKEGCMQLPDNAVLLASSSKCPQMFKVKDNIYVTQFHPELDAEGLEVRINIYKEYGYFDPADAQTLIDAGYNEKITEPMKILTNFVNKYR